MLIAASKALSQMLSPPFRSILLRSMGFALAVLIVLGIVLQRLIAWSLDNGAAWLQTTFSWMGAGPVSFLELSLAVIATLGIFAAMIFLMPSATALVAGVFADDIAAQVERTHYPADPPGKALPIASAVLQGIQTAFLGLLVYLCAVPFLLVAGLGLVIFFVATSYLLGREYFLLAAMRFRSPQEAKILRKKNRSAIFLAGLPIAAFVSIPIVNLATPLFGTAYMVHIHKRLTDSRGSDATG
jgi:uncharacterized protein involved in cysteine biosynthesis